MVIYPNPATDFIYLDGDTHEGPGYKIMDVYGRTLLAGKSDGKQEIDIRSLTAGIYLMIYSSYQGELWHSTFVKAD